ncbi:5822_t:CDS:2 [Cetraspora pellucida]|uniref:5822_t:CDS:1 n=1 Tax=Cetraspora pellucida TaxID=1433469 RepID=A0A9N9EM44_9GLOM|nr:5822_t:CDS:2 [Cetraspora pellucida]
MHKSFGFVIFLLFINFATSFPYSIFRRDSLSGFTKCNGTFPIEITSFSFSPNPVIIGQNVTFTFSFVSTETIQQGVTLNDTAYYQQQPGNYTIVSSGYLTPTPNDPKNITIEYDLKFEVANPGNPATILTCMEGKYPIHFP